MGIKKNLSEMVDEMFHDVGLTDDEENRNDIKGQKGGSSQLSSDQGKGWHGDSDGQSEAGKKAADTAEERYGADFHESIGAKGGRSAQQSGNAHELTEDERREGGKVSSSRQDMSKIGKKGGLA